MVAQRSICQFILRLHIDNPKMGPAIANRATRVQLRHDLWTEMFARRRELTHTILWTVLITHIHAHTIHPTAMPLPVLTIYMTLTLILPTPVARTSPLVRKKKKCQISAIQVKAHAKPSFTSPGPIAMIAAESRLDPQFTTLSLAAIRSRTFEADLAVQPTITAVLKVEVVRLVDQEVSIPPDPLHVVGSGHPIKAAVRLRQSNLGTGEEANRKAQVGKVHRHSSFKPGRDLAEEWLWAESPTQGAGSHVEVVKLRAAVIHRVGEADLADVVDRKGTVVLEDQEFPEVLADLVALRRQDADHLKTLVARQTQTCFPSTQRLSDQA